FAGCWFGKIANNGNMRAIVFASFNLLRFIGSHPSTISLSSSRMKVGIKDGDQFTFVVFYFVCFYVSVVFIDVLHFLKMKSVQFFGNGKNAVYYVFQFKIGLQLFIIEIEKFLFQLF